MYIPTRSGAQVKFIIYKFCSDKFTRKREKGNNNFCHLLKYNPVFKVQYFPVFIGALECENNAIISSTWDEENFQDGNKSVNYILCWRFRDLNAKMENNFHVEN